MASLFDLLSQNSPNLQTRRALILLGLQNDFLSPDGKLPVSTDLGFMDHLTTLIDGFRGFGEVIWVRTEIEPDQQFGVTDRDDYNVILSVDDDTAPSASGQKSHHQSSADSLREDDNPTDTLSNFNVEMSSNALRPKHSSWEASQEDVPFQQPDEESFLTRTVSRDAWCVKGSLGAEIAPQLKPLINSHDLQVVKTQWSAFKNTSLLLTLRSRLITELFVCGCMTNMSVYATAVDAARYGIKITVVDDCLGYRMKERHELALHRLVDFMEAEVASSHQVLETLQNPPLEASDVDDDDDDDDDDDVEWHDPEEYRQIADEIGQASTADLLEVDSDDGADDIRMPKLQLQTYFKRRLEMRPISAKRPKSPSPTAAQRRQRSAQRQSDGSPRNTKSIELSSNPHSLDHQPTSSSRADDADTQRSATENLYSAASESPESSNHLDHARTSLKRRISAESLQQDRSRHPASTSTDIVMADASQDVSEAQEDAKSQAPGSHDAIGQSTRQPLFGIDQEKESAESSICCPLLPPELADGILYKLQNEIQWERMFHQTGEVPRLVCCQGTIADDGSMPVYRHPSDRSMPLLAWSPTVMQIREAAEKIVGHGLNHALIQLYRTGNDFISEHSDKTLDIVPGSNIVNVSFGAERTMRLRTKRTVSGISTPRTTHRVRMPHNSMITMSLETNAEYLHGINADKRPRVELSEAEMAFGGQRISLTFRQIGTFLSADSRMIWGQGATGKTISEARPTINGRAEASDSMVRAFGMENQSSRIDWEAWYGVGTDVLHLK